MKEVPRLRILPKTVIAATLCSAMLLSACGGNPGTELKMEPIGEILRKQDQGASITSWRNALTDEQKAMIDLAYENRHSSGFEGTLDEWIDKEVVARIDHDGHVVVVLPDGTEFTVDTAQATGADGTVGTGAALNSPSASGTAARAPIAVDEHDKDSSEEQDLHPATALVSGGTVRAATGSNDVAVPVEIHRNPGILGMTVSVSYDEDALTLVSSECGEAFGKLSMSHSKDYGTGTVFTWDGLELSDGDVRDGIILTLYFDVKPGTKPGTYPISIRSDGSAVDRNLDGTTVSVQDGAIIVD